MDVIAWLIIAFLNVYYAHGLFFDKPISLGIVKQDLQILGKQLSSADQWPVNRIIKYDDKIQFVVAYGQQTANDANQKTFLTVVGHLSVATFKRSQGGGLEVASVRFINRLLVDQTNVYFDDLRQPVQNLGDFYIVYYYPAYTQMKTDSKPIIEYMSEKQFERELIDHIPRIRDESSVSKAVVIKTYIRMKNGNKIHVRYHHTFDVAVFEGDFYCLINNDGRSLIEKAIHFKKFSYDFERLLAPELLKIGYTYAVRVVSFPSHSVDSPTPSLKMVKNVLLKDVLDSISMKTKGASDTVGVIKYDSNKILTLNSPSKEQNFALSLNSKFLTSDGIPFSWLCIAFPQGQSDGQSVSELKNSNKFSGKLTFFSCPESGKDSQIVFQEDTDVIEIASEESKTMDAIQNLSNVEPYIEYISYQQFRRTLQILSQVMTFKCAEEQQYQIRSFRLYEDVFLNYDCNTNLIYFETLNLWLKPGEEVSSLENIRSVSYDSNTTSFQLEGRVFSQFKLRQLNPGFRDKIPTALRFIGHSGSNNIAFDLKSLEWDLFNIRDDLLKNWLPQWGVVYVDNSVLFVAEKSERTIDGMKKWTIVVKCNVPKPESCTKRECMGENLVIYDGTKMIVRDRKGVDINPLPTKVYWPDTQKLPLLNDAFSVSHRVHYIKLSTFRKNMKELSDGLRSICTMHKGHGSNDKLTLRVYYPRNKDPMIGYYNCALNYIMFSSSFKVFKFSTMYEGETTVGPASSDGSYPPVMKSKELPTAESWRNDRTKNLQSEYVLQDLLYDLTEDVFHSKSTSLTEVYALLLLPNNWKVTIPKGNSTKLQLGGEIKVDVF